MRYIKIGIISIFVICTVAFSINWVKDKKDTDGTYPVIQISSDIQEISVKDKDTEFLKGIVANDEKDGDLTNNIVIESISKFVDKENHIANVTYVVKDSDNHVTKKTRKVKFTDYTSPRFSLSQPLCFNVGEEIDVTKVIGATDCYDGDISSKVKLLSSTVRTSMAGEYAITAQVTNSLGDTTKLKAVVVIRQNNALGPQIVLKENLVYVKKGKSFDEEDYVENVIDVNGKVLDNVSASVVSSTVKTNKAGSYIVQYMAKDKDGNEGYAYLTVIVEE